MRSSAICQAIFSEIKSIWEIRFKQRIGVQTFCQLYDWSHPPASVSFKFVRWEVKDMGRLILNMDGCSKDNPVVGGGGGVLRDSTGLPLVAFSAFFGITTCLRAETLAFLIGLQICVHRGFTNLWVQSDSLVLVWVLQRRIQCPWQIQREVWQIWQLVEDPARFSHCYREANTVADALSNVGVSHPEQHVKVYDCFRMFPRLARGAIRLDRLGMPSVRKFRHM